MRNILAALAVALALGACATNVSPVESIVAQECSDGNSVKDVLAEQNAKYPDYNVHIENVVEGEVVATLIAGSGLKADKIVVLGAVVDGEPSGGLVLLAVDGACVQGRKNVQRDQAEAMGMLPTE